jgi:broad specificity phosphatase PhoE
MKEDPYDPSHPRLRELVLVHIDTEDGESFDQLLTRVPGLGEEIVREDRKHVFRFICKHMGITTYG